MLWQVQTEGTCLRFFKSGSSARGTLLRLLMATRLQSFVWVQPLQVWGHLVSIWASWLLFLLCFKPFSGFLSFLKPKAHASLAHRTFGLLSPVSCPSASLLGQPRDTGLSLQHVPLVLSLCPDCPLCLEGSFHESLCG